MTVFIVISFVVFFISCQSIKHDESELRQRVSTVEQRLDSLIKELSTQKTGPILKKKKPPEKPVPEQVSSSPVQIRTSESFLV